MSAFYTNLGSLAHSRALLRVPGRADDALLIQAGYRFQEALRWDPVNGRPYHHLGLIYLAWGQKAAAQEALEKAVRWMPTDRLASHQLGILYDDLRWEARAVAAWKSGNSAPWLVREGLRCQGKGDVACAERFYRLAIAVQPGYWEAHYRLGGLYAELGQTEEAIEAYTAAMALEPEYHPRRFLIQARILALQGEWPAAIAACRRAMELNPSDPEPYEQIAAILRWHLDDGEGAAQWYRAAIAADRQRTSPYLHLAELYEARQDYSQAEFWYRQALPTIRANPVTLAEAQAGVSRCALAQGNLEAALQAAEAAVNAQPQVAAYHLLRADVWLAMKHYPPAIAGYRSALELDPNNRRAQQQLKALGWREP